MSIPYIPLFVAEFEADTLHLTAEQDGVFNRLLRLCWRTPGCSVPNDRAWIQPRLRLDDEAWERSVEPVIAEFFKIDKGRLFSSRLQREWERINATTAARRAAGRKGGRPVQPTDNKGSAAKPGLNKTKAGPKHSHTHTHKDPPTPQGGSGNGADHPSLQLVQPPSERTSPSIDERFDEFWKVYPRHEEKKRARDRFARILKAGEATAAQVIAGARAYAAQMQAEGREQPKVKHPTTWLNGACWEDDYTPPRPPADESWKKGLTPAEIAEVERRAAEKRRQQG